MFTVECGNISVQSIQILTPVCRNLRFLECGMLKIVSLWSFWKIEELVLQTNTSGKCTDVASISPPYHRNGRNYFLFEVKKREKT
jgi:hypothetical protein